MYLDKKNTHSYESTYDSEELRGVDDTATPRPWDLVSLISNYGGPCKSMLDIGCGTAFKLLPLSEKFKKIVGVEPSESMRKAAEKKISLKNIRNITIVDSCLEKFNPGKDRFDVVTSMLAKFDPSIISRYLKPSGVCIVEHVGCEDKKKFKEYFGKDEDGWRGQLLHYHKDDYVGILQNWFEQFFSEVTVTDGTWNTYYTESGINSLLRNTPTIRGYSEQLDCKNTMSAINDLKTPRGIKITQNRVLIHAKNPKQDKA